MNCEHNNNEVDLCVKKSKNDVVNAKEWRKFNKIHLLTLHPNEVNVKYKVNVCKKSKDRVVEVEEWRKFNKVNL